MRIVKGVALDLGLGAHEAGCLYSDVLGSKPSIS